MNGTHKPNDTSHAQPAPPQQQQGPIGSMVAAIQTRDPRLKSAPLASFLSIIPGLGQIYVGYYQRGFIHAMVVAALISLMTVVDTPPVLPFAPLFMVFFWLYNIIDAGRRATYYNQVLAGGDVPDVPEDFRMPGIRGSILGGLILIAFGAIALSNTRFDYSLDWIEEWWPALPILLGAFLLIKAIQERGNADGN